MSESTQTQAQTETVKETVVRSEPAESVVETDAGVSSDVEQGDASVEVSDGETSVAASADDPVALTVAVVLGLFVVAGLAVKILLNK